MRGRDYVLPRDVFDVARDVLRHRLVLLATRRWPTSVDAPTTSSPRVPVHRAGPRRSPRRQHEPAPAEPDAGHVPAAGASVTSGHRRRPSPAASANLRQLELAVTRKLDGLLHGDHQRPHPRLGQRSRRGPAVPAGRRRPAHRLEPDAPARRSPRARHDRRSRARDLAASSTAAPASTSARPAGRSATSRSPRPPRSASCRGEVGNRVGAVVFDGARHRRSCRRAPGVDAVHAAAAPAASRGRGPASARPSLADALAQARAARQAPRPGRGRLRPARPRRRGRRAARCSPPATTWSSPRSAIPASASCPPSGCSRSSTPRPVGAARCRPPTPKLRARFAAAAAAAPTVSTPTRSVAPAPRHLVLSTDRDWMLDVVRVRRELTSGMRRR